MRGTVVRSHFCCHRCGLRNQTEHFAFSKAEGVCICQETEVYWGRREMYWHMWKDKLNAVSPRGKPRSVAAAAVVRLVPGYGLTLKARPLPIESK